MNTEGHGFNSHLLERRTGMMGPELCGLVGGCLLGCLLPPPSVGLGKVLCTQGDLKIALRGGGDMDARRRRGGFGEMGFYVTPPPPQSNFFPAQPCPFHVAPPPLPCA